MRRKPIAQMTTEELRAYNRERQRRWRARAKADPEKAAELSARGAEHTARWLAGIMADDERRAAYKERQRLRNREKYWRNKNSAPVKNNGLQRPK